MFTATIILILTYIGIAFTHLPKLNVDRPTAALVGGVCMVLFGVLTYQQAVSAIDFNTIALLLGMMIIVSALQAAGFFHLLAIKSLSLASTPTRLLTLIVLATALCSAFFVNDAVVLLFTPIVIASCRSRKVNPVPYLIAEALASNIGSTATIVGNPQNMLIGVTAGISFVRFFMYLLPVAALSTLALIYIVRWVDGTASRQGFDFSTPLVPATPHYDVKAIKRLAPALILVMAGFFMSSIIKVSIPLVALAGAVAALMLGKTSPDKVLRGVNWLLLLFFAGLFVVIGGARQAGVLDVFINRIVVTPGIAGIASLHAVSAVVSQIVSNVPLTMFVIPLLKNVPGDTLWIALAAGSTLGGNLTIIGAVANIIVVEEAAKEGVTVGFGQFAKVGSLVTFATIVLSILVLSLEFQLGWLR